jgi:hypothetical protein
MSIHIVGTVPFAQPRLARAFLQRIYPGLKLGSHGDGHTTRRPKGLYISQSPLFGTNDQRFTAGGPQARTVCDTLRIVHVLTPPVTLW